MSEAQLFDRVGRALYGDHYVAPLAHALGNDKNVVGKWRAGKAAVPTGVWHDLKEMIQLRGLEIEAVRLAVTTLELGEPKA